MKDEFEKDHTSRKEIHKSSHDDIEDALLQWFKVQRSSNISVSGSILQAKAIDFVKLLKKDDFVQPHGSRDSGMGILLALEKLSINIKFCIYKFFV